MVQLHKMRGIEGRVSLTVITVKCDVSLEFKTKQKKCAGFKCIIVNCYLFVGLLNVSVSPG